MHELNSCSGRRVACDSASREAVMRDETVCGDRVLDTTQIRGRIAFSSAADVTIQHFNESRQRARVSKVRAVLRINPTPPQGVATINKQTAPAV